MPQFDQKYGGHVAITMTAGKDVKGGQVLKMTEDNTVEPCTAGAAYVGIAGNDVPKGGLVTVHYHVVGSVTMGDAVRPGEYVKTGADGKAVKAASASEAGTFGVCLAGGTTTKPALIRAGI